ncbi:hypothetical protein V3H18_11360 [Methylocystis sp. 9N]|uniref:Uncharacterized protein n=1 Tax=Methylocystis borbori TaxID=3118750 RepID=A0ABU7XIB6_9HYPH
MSFSQALKLAQRRGDGHSKISRDCDVLESAAARLRAAIEARTRKDRFAILTGIGRDLAILEGAFDEAAIVENAGAAEIVLNETAALEFACDEVDAPERAAAKNAVDERLNREKLSRSSFAARRSRRRIPLPWSAWPRSSFWRHFRRRQWSAAVRKNTPDRVIRPLAFRCGIGYVRNRPN